MVFIKKGFCSLKLYQEKQRKRFLLNNFGLMKWRSE